MLTIKVKFTSGLFKVYPDIKPKDANFKDGILTIATNQTLDENGNWKSGEAVRIPLVNIMYFETVETGEGITVEGEGKVKE